LNNRETAFLQLMEAHKGIIHKISKMYMDNGEDQQDLFQEIIYQLWKSYDSFNNRSKFSTWMYRVALNTAVVFLRKESRKISSTPQLPEHLPAEESPAAMKELQLAHFYRAVQKLDNIEKALVFYHLENYAHKEIAESLGISEVNARVKLNRAKTKLKAIIKQQGYEF